MAGAFAGPAIGGVLADAYGVRYASFLYTLYPGF